MQETSRHQVTFSGWRLAQLSSFRIGSAMVEILATSIWNRIMITTLGLPATAVGFLLALRYFLSPLSVWVGHRSDTVSFLGFYRTSYIWLGRFLTVLSLPFLGWSVILLEADRGSPLGWGVAVFCFILYAIGSVLSGSPYLALVRDSAPREKQGLSISITETVFIVFIATAAIGFSVWMNEYNQAIFWQMIIACMTAGGFFWFLGVLGVENASIPPAVRRTELMQKARQRATWETFRQIWGDQRTRLFFFFLSLSTLSAWSQDTILEPFGAEVLNLPIDITTRFTGYWQLATVVTLIGGAFLWRKRRPEKQTGITSWGLIGMGCGMLLISLEAFLAYGGLITLALVIFGAGFGIYTFGSLSLMAVMATDEDAGAYLGLWTISILVFKGLGNFLGGFLRDLFLLILNFDGTVSYGLTFGLAAFGLFGSVYILSRLDVWGFAQEVGRVDVEATEGQTAAVEV
ncbi:MAG: BCD family MFS transporter [Ardenticatenaceae bacterium]|nr:BCD family MFS transporter [Ardenticatenaceae bacterium]